MAEEKTYVFDGASRNDIPLAYALNNNGGWGNGLGGWGGGIVGFLLGLAFGGGWGGFGGWGNGGFGGGVSGLVNSDSNRDVVLQAINGTDKIDPFGEELAYLIGEIGFNTFPIAKQFLCEHCREEIK